MLRKQRLIPIAVIGSTLLAFGLIPAESPAPKTTKMILTQTATSATSVSILARANRTASKLIHPIIHEEDTYPRADVLDQASGLFLIRYLPEGDEH